MAGPNSFFVRAFEIPTDDPRRSEEHTSELQSRQYLVCRLLLEKKKNRTPLTPIFPIVPYVWDEETNGRTNRLRSIVIHYFIMYRQSWCLNFGCHIRY